MGTSVDERRRYKRIPTTAIVEIGPAEKQMPDKHVTAETLNMSPGGLLFCSDHAFEVGSRWKLKMLLERSRTLNADWELRNHRIDRPSAVAVCRVVRTHGAPEIGYEVAVEFESIDAEHAEAVKAFLAESQ
jgi:c-di-GMP-binding flagellar brake protein YcgR